MARLAGKAAFITGAGTGIGRATAEVFAREGARVTIAEIDAASGEETAQRIQAAGGQAIAITTDVRVPESIEASIRKAAQHWGGLHVLHNNAGGSTLVDSNVVDVPLEEFWRAITLDLFGTFLGCRFGIPEIIRSGGGSVINMASAVALMGFEGRDCYTAAKGGIAALTRSLAVQYGRQGVRVNAIAPSVTMTDRVKRLLAESHGVKQVADQHLLGLGEPLDVAHAALYLASDEARITTGSILPIDSGVVVA
ncbi:short-chain dehydrogenase [Siccirubricoccus deserti]|uniref:SDR family oxidoreductase n=1 Tax=Siccirubricoccus deserti TaxID=2013562 RepID=A0A9X0QW63_9PROT|nr:SDR family oxidoreductase [Siccirubricoccus deserti]MBC4014028.1 SDR family oxidoreductase [Siccirubricoccus deserti]GGC25901.1 short-chain dehydrogenase [Siccirubricoccus deserti]